MTDRETRKQKLIRDRDFLRARMAENYALSAKEKAELEAIEGELARIETEERND